MSLRAEEPQETRPTPRIKCITSALDTSGLCPQPGETAAGTSAENVIHVTRAREPRGVNARCLLPHVGGNGLEKLGVMVQFFCISFAKAFRSTQILVSVLMMPSIQTVERNVYSNRSATTGTLS